MRLCRSCARLPSSVDFMPNYAVGRDLCRSAKTPGNYAENYAGTWREAQCTTHFRRSRRVSGAGGEGDHAPSGQLRNHRHRDDHDSDLLRRLRSARSSAGLQLYYWRARMTPNASRRPIRRSYRARAARGCIAHRVCGVAIHALGEVDSVAE